MSETKINPRMLGKVMCGIWTPPRSKLFSFLVILLALALAILNFAGAGIELPNFLPDPINLHTAERETSILADNPFCNLLEGALTPGPENRTMIHALVSNSGHFPFLHNLLLSMRRNGLTWKPLVLSIGGGVCPMLANVSEFGDNVLCVPYLDRLLHQLQRDEPESVEQIQPYLAKNASSSGDNDANFSTVVANFYGWGSVEHKFLINSKLYALRDVLECGADAFITDTDIAFRRDPRPYFAISGPGGDIVAQNDTTNQFKLSLNSGFMYWKRTNQNLDLIQDIITVPLFWHVDQARVNARMHNRSTPHTLLDAFKFPNGFMINEYSDKLDDAVVFHANWNDKQHQKEGMLQKVGMWFLNETAD